MLDRITVKRGPYWQSLILGLFLPVLMIAFIPIVLGAGILGFLSDGSEQKE